MAASVHCANLVREGATFGDTAASAIVGLVDSILGQDCKVGFQAEMVSMLP